MSWLPATIQERLVIVLAHFVWQGVVVAALLAALVALLNLKRPSMRYASSLLAFVLMSVCPIVTWFVVPNFGVRGVSPALDQSHEQFGKTVHADDLPLNPFAGPRVEPFDASTPDHVAVDFRIINPPPPQLATETKPHSVSDWRQTLHPFEPWIVGIWLCGVGMLSLRLLLGAIGLWRWRRGVDVLPESLVPIVARLCAALSMVEPRVRVCRRVGEAVAVGLFKPMILLPAAWLVELPPDMLEAVLAHELAHVRRLDLWVNLLQRLVETLLFYHPAVWWLSRRLRIERELCCDELAATVTNDRLRYAETLEHVARLIQSRPVPILSVAMSGREGVLLHRIRQLLGVTSPSRTGGAWLAGAVTLGIVLTIALGAFVSSRAQGEKPTADKKPNADRPIVLTFPSDRSVGEVAIRLKRDNGWSVVGRYEDWNGSIPAIGDVHIPAGHEVTLTAVRDETDRSFEWLDKLPTDGIRKLDLSYGKISEEGLRRVGRLTGLRELKLQGVRLTDAGVQHLSTLTELRHLDLNGGHVCGNESRVSDESLRVLLQMPLLESLDLRGKAVTDSGMPYLARLTSLQDLSLSGTKVTDAGLAALEPLQSLLYLRLGLENFMDQDEADESKHFTDAALPHVAKLKKLQALHLGGCSITDDGLKALRGMPELVNLDLNWTKVTGSGFSHLAELPKLKLISPPSGCDDLGLAQLAKIRTLTGVFSSFEHVTDKGFAELAKIKGLERLSLGSQQMTNAGLRHIGAMPALSELILEGTGPRITVAGLAEFAKQSNIEWLALRDVHLSERADGVEKIETEPPLQALRDFRNLKYLEIAQLIAERGPATELDLPVLAELQTLEHLSVSHHPMSPRTLAYASRMPKLESFDFSENVVEDKDVANLRGFPSLRKLSLPLTRLTDTGLASLTRFTQLEELSIGGPITDAGLLALKALPKLKYLEIRSPHVTAQGLSSLQAAMPSLKHARQFGFEVPESLDNKVAQSLRRGAPLSERRRAALADARLEYQRALIVFVDELSPRTKSLFSVLKPRDGDFEDFDQPLTDYAQLWVSAATDEERTSAQRELQLPKRPLKTPSLAVVAADGKLVASQDVAFDSSDQLDLKSLQEFLTQHMLPPRDAEELLREALAKATREDKRVLLQESGIGCYPCRLLSRFIEQHRDIFDEHFVTLKVDPFRWKNGVEIMQRFRPRSGGIPWVAILDATGKRLGTSDDPDGENYGFPSEPAEIERFLKLLKSTAPKLSDKQTEVLRLSLANREAKAQTSDPRAGRGSPDPALAPTVGLPNSDEDTNPPNSAIGDLRSKPAAGSGDPRRAQGNSGGPPELRVMKQPTVLLPDHWIVAAVGFDHDGKELVTASTQSFVTIRRWDVVGKKLISEIKLEGGKQGKQFREGTLMLSADRRRVIAATDTYVGIWETATGKLLKQLPIPKIENNDTVRLLTCTPDFSVIVGSLETNYERTTLVYDAHTVVWDGTSGKMLRTLTHKNATRLVAISVSSDGSRLATTNGLGTSFWATNSSEQRNHVWNDNKGWKHPNPEVSNQYANHVWSIQFSPNGEQLAIGDILGVKLLDARSGKVLQQLEGPYRYSSSGSPRLVFSKDGQWLARLGTQEKADGDKYRYVVPIWSTQTGKKLLELHTESNDAAFSDDGQRLAVGFSDMQQALSIWSLNAAAANVEQPAGPGPHSRQDRVEENGHYVGK